MNIEIKKVTKLKQIMPLFFHVDLYEGFVNDKSISKKLFKKFIKNSLNDKYIFYVFIYNSIPIGLSVLRKITNYCLIGHIGILKRFRGKIAYKAASKLLNIIFNALNYKKIIAPIVSTNKAAIYFVKQLGFQLYGTYKNQLLWEINHG